MDEVVPGLDEALDVHEQVAVGKVVLKPLEQGVGEARIVPPAAEIFSAAASRSS